MKLPQRPDSFIFADHLFEGAKSPYLVLDEAHIVKNPKSYTSLAIQYLREQCEAVIMLTGTPLDNNWLDVRSLANFLQGHPFSNSKAFNVTFSHRDKCGPGRYVIPQGTRCSFVNFLRA